ncbi:MULTISPECIES: C40 family peptidase [Citrobacter]|uniref:C40 family peptidase n=1 Tax=Citrobacter TaxID=544 RepID=UPI0005390B3F|nr:MULTISPECIES: C40 family peptidase [Citrobacter]EKV5609875.1 C40 family peptidase [Citrobacter koseri]EKW5653860.1 C40 family peptidase [Citrobacter koseri]EKX8764522.1 C40 family peptidase [Citrobacter koseri]EKY0738709.1 C40 family peptidase [Citrobacter koseri]ELJ2665796.1 C40 family peptidase [Citrobacter koseri]
MARINRISITLCALLFTTLPFTSMAHASRQARATPAAHVTKTADKQKNTATSKKKTKTAKKAVSKTQSKTASTSKKRIASPAKTTKTSKTASRRSKPATTQTAAVTWTEKCTPRKGRKPHCVKVKGAPLAIADAHKAKMQKATNTAMNKLMNQIGKPYRWGGTSPRTGFDCSGLVYYAYKDLVKFRIPRTANEMYHLRDAAPIERGELKNGDLVFFRTQGRGTADHVGVYVGNGKFIQSPRSGQEIQITSLSEDYWQRHYVGARRVMTPKTIR